MREMRSVAVLRLGFVGLPLATAFARAGLKVLGVDTDAGKVECLAVHRAAVKIRPAGGVEHVSCLLSS